MKHLIYKLLFVGFLISSQIGFSIPAYKGLIKLTQPDGTEINAYVYGDERLSWYSTEDKFTLLINNQGYFEYATLNYLNDLVPSGIIAKNQKDRSIQDINFLNSIPKDLRYSQDQIEVALQMTEFMETKLMKSQTIEGVSSGIRKLLVIMVDYPAGTYNSVTYNATSFSFTKQDFENLFNQVNYNYAQATGSVRDYFKATSYNKLDLQSTIAGPYTLPQPRPFYGAQSGQINDINSKQMIYDACNLANNDGIDFSNYDNDGDLKVDGVHVIYAGRGQHNSGETDAIWPHRGRLSPALVLDGVQIIDYSCSSEKRSFSDISGIGVHCHEFGHVLGLWDYYDTDYASNGISKTLSDFELMDGGAYNNSEKTPPLWNAYSLAQLGWADIYEIDSNMLVDIISLPAKDTNIIYKINTTTPNEYYLLQNRYRYKWDNYFFKDAGSLMGGLLLLHVDHNCQGFAEHNCINCYASHNGVRLVSADNNYNGVEYGGSWTFSSTGNLLFPGGSNIQTLGDNNTSSANLKSWAGANSGVEISNITYNQGQISFKVNGGADYGVKVHTFAATDISHTSATLNGSIENSILGDTNIIEAGIVIDTIPFPKYSSLNSYPISQRGDYTYSIQGLMPGMEYYYRTYGKNSNGISYGEDILFLTTSDNISGNFVLDSNFAACSTGEMPTIIGSSPIGGSGVYKYKWLESTDGIVFQETTSPGNKKDYTPSVMTQPTYFKRIAMSADKADTSAHKLVGIVDATVAGTIVPSLSSIKEGESTGDITLSGHSGNIEFWQRKKDSDLWATIQNTANINPFSEVIEEEGTYKYRVRVRNGACPFQYSNIIEIIVNTIGLDDIDGDKIQFSIYPNPNKGEFVVDLNSAEKSNLELVITNISGQILYNKKNIENKVNINLPNIQNGNYIIMIKDNEKVVGSKQIIITK